MRSHGGFALHNLATLANLELNRGDTCLLVMPMCHANSLFFASAFAYAGASSCVYDAKSFEPEQLLRTLAHERATFTSLVPTHYIMMLALPDAVRASCNVDSVRRLLISSAPARKDTKLAIWSASGTRSCSRCTARPSRDGRRCCGPTSNSRSSVRSAAS